MPFIIITDVVFMTVMYMYRQKKGIMHVVRYHQGIL